MSFVAVVAGLVAVAAGDAVHSWTWFRTGITTPTPGSDPLPNRAYALHMMGMNVVLLGCLVLGAVRLRSGANVRWLGWALLAVTPVGILSAVTWLPTSPAGALWGLALLVAFLPRAHPPGAPISAQGGQRIRGVPA